MRKNFFLFILILFNVICTYSGDKERIYLLYKTNAHMSSYYDEHHSFFQHLFGEKYDIKPVYSLKNIKNFKFIITDEISQNDEEIKYLSKHPKEKILLFTFEPPLIETRSNNIFYHQFYSKIFTWNDDLIDNKKYFKVRFPWMDPRPMVQQLSFKERKLLVFVGANQQNTQDIENYSERKKLIDFFEDKPVGEFEFYGNRWPSSYKNYKGVIGLQANRRSNKINIIKRYKFDVCYENCKNINGWVSERIFESFAAGCVPIYWGASNITDYIPQGCYIDRNDFKNNDELYEFIKNMPEDIFLQYIQNINAYLHSDAAKKVSTLFYIQEIQKVLNLEQGIKS